MLSSTISLSMTRGMLLLLAALLLMAFAPTAVHAQRSQSRFTDDPELLGELYRGDFDAVDRDQATLVNVLALGSIFGDFGCFADDADDPETLAASRQAVRFVFSFSREHGDIAVAAGLFRRENPQFPRVAAWLDEHGCHTEKTQTLFRNVTKLLASRNSAAEWGVGSGSTRARRRRP